MAAHAAAGGQHLEADRGRGQRQRHRDGGSGDEAEVEGQQEKRERCAAGGQLGGAEAKDELSHDAEAVDRKLEAEGEEQQRYSHFGGRRQCRSVGNSDRAEPGIVGDEGAEGVGADEDADEDEADDGGDAERRKGGDDEPGGAEDDEDVVEGG